MLTNATHYQMESESGINVVGPAELAAVITMTFALGVMTTEIAIGLKRELTSATPTPVGKLSSMPAQWPVGSALS